MTTCWGQYAGRALVGVLALASVTMAMTVQAQPLTSSATVGVSAVVVDRGTTPINPIVEFHGAAAPQAVITIRRGGTIVVTQTAASTADFSISLMDQPAGQQSYLISATDVSGVALAPVTFALNLSVNTNTIITGIFLGPSISIDKTSVKLGQFITVAGSTAPASAVTVAVNSDSPVSYNINADSGGRWSKLVNTQEIGVGTHTASARAVTSGNQVSAASATVSFAVNPLEQCDGKKTADLNCDNNINLTDFSILLYFWQQTNPSNSRADINGDGRTDVIDFSIMLYQWTV